MSGERIEVPCKFGTLVAYESGDRGYFNEISVDLVLPDGGLIQIATIGTNEFEGERTLPANYYDMVHTYLFDGDNEDCQEVFYTNPDGECVYR